MRHHNFRQAELDRRIVVEIKRPRRIKRCPMCELAKSTKCFGPCALRDVHAQMSAKSPPRGGDLGEAAAMTFPRRETPTSPGRTIDQAWTVLTAAHDIDDLDMVTLCRRVIDAQLMGRNPLQSDLAAINAFFK
jgi:hypothetical protein